MTTPVTTTKRRDLAVGVIIALVGHVAGFAWAFGLQKPEITPKKRTRTVNMDVKLPPKPTPKPKQVAQQQPQPKPKPAPEPIAKKPVTKPAPKKVAKRSKKRRVKRKRRRAPKKVARKTPPRPKAEPAPLVLSKAYEGSGGVAVEKGDDDVLGDPAVEVTAENRRPQPPQDVAEYDEDEDEDEEEEEVAAVIRHARPQAVCKVTWPQEAPMQRRIVTVQMLLTVNKVGKVAEARVLRSVGQPFDAAAVKALRSCRFSPGTRNGQPFTDRVPFLVEFRPGTGV